MDWHRSQEISDEEDWKMAKVEKTITINAPVEKVFEYVDDAYNLPEFWPSVVAVSDVERLPNGGSAHRWVYKMAGMRFEGTSEDIEYIANQRIVTKTRGGIESTHVWLFEPADGGTKLTTETEYKVPVPVLGKLAEAVIVKLNENEADVLLANLKARMEV
jgi:uncharacterized membrane protein